MRTLRVKIVPGEDLKLSLLPGSQVSPKIGGEKEDDEGGEPEAKRKPSRLINVEFSEMEEDDEEEEEEEEEGYDSGASTSKLPLLRGGNNNKESGDKDKEEDDDEEEASTTSRETAPPLLDRNRTGERRRGRTAAIIPSRNVSDNRTRLMRMKTRKRSSTAPRTRR